MMHFCKFWSFYFSVNWIDDQRESMVGYKSSPSNVWWKVFKKRASQPSPDKANKTITVYVTQTAQFVFSSSHNKHQNKKVGGKTTYYARWSRQDKDSPRDSKASQETQNNTVANANNQLKIVREREIQQQTWDAGLFTNRTSVVTERGQHKQQNKKMRKRN